MTLLKFSCFLTLFIGAFGASVTAHSASRERAVIPHQLIVKFKPGVRGARALDSRQFRVIKNLVPKMNVALVKMSPGLSFRAAVSQLRRHPQVLYVQKNRRLQRRSTPNDPRFSNMWNFNETLSPAHVSAPGAWEIVYKGPKMAPQNVVVAVVDGGADIQHEDLKENIWVNRGEVPGNGVDDDQNGYIDDVHGWNAGSRNGQIPRSTHGTHVAGTVGARGNNGKGVVGVNWRIGIMPVAAGRYTTASVLAAYGYVLAQKTLWLKTKGRKGANVVATNSSFGHDRANCNNGEYPAWNDIYNEMGRVGILSAVATANRGYDVDVVGDVPSGCSSPFVVSVTNTDSRDRRNSGAAWGLKAIDLGAPGTAILSTVPGNRYQSLTGTSMATPHVAGAIGLLHMIRAPKLQGLARQKPAQTALFIKKALLTSVDPNPSLEGKTVSGGRLNLEKAARAVSRRAFRRRR